MNTPRNVRAAVFTAVLALVSLAPASPAQDHSVGARVDVPFAFQTGNQHFAAGMYTISMEKPDLLFLKGASGSGFVLMHPGGSRQPAVKSKVVFRRSGNHYFLGELWIAEKSGHLDVIKSKAERKIEVAEQKSASAGSVELALLQPAL